jgi:hypothetical protein
MRRKPQMPATKTPGQVAYDAFCAAADGWFPPPWRTLLPDSQAVWEATAQAVLAMREEKETP